MKDGEFVIKSKAQQDITVKVNYEKGEAHFNAEMSSHDFTYTGNIVTWAAPVGTIRIRHGEGQC
jgi:hypothetical protein